MTRRWREIGAAVAMAVLATSACAGTSPASAPTPASTADAGSTAAATAATAPAAISPVTTEAAPPDPPTTTAPAPATAPPDPPTTTAPAPATAPPTPMLTLPPDPPRAVRVTTTTQALPPGASGEGRRLFLLGDSVMAAMAPNYTDAAEQVLGAAGWDVVLDAMVNRTIGGGLAELEAHGDEIADTVVVMLGHNDDLRAFPARATTLLRALEGVERVYWLTMREPTYAPDNAAFRDLTAEFPNLHIIDWAGQIEPGWTAKDGLHLNGSGATGMAALIRDSL